MLVAKEAAPKMRLEVSSGSPCRWGRYIPELDWDVWAGGSSVLQELICPM